MNKKIQKNHGDWVASLKALADPVRLDLVRHLLEAPDTVEQLAARLGYPEYTVSRHLKILRQAGVIQSEKQGRHLLNAISPPFRKSVGKKLVLDLGCCRFDFNR